MLRRKPPLPEAHHRAWGAFLDCAEVIAGGRRVLFSTLPAGRVEPAPVGVGLDALARSLADARGWMPDWRIDEVEPEWHDCSIALDDAAAAVAHAREVSAHTSELEELLEAVGQVTAPLDAFADAERAWRRRWRLPRG